MATTLLPVRPAQQPAADTPVLPEVLEEIAHWKRVRHAVILAHNYQIGPIQDLADFTGDSLGLSQHAARTEAETIVFCGVHFMAETAAILSPAKTVLLPDLDAGCSLASSITAEQLRAWKAEHPGAVVVSYVNTSAEVKAESDYCCTSGNALAVIRAIPADREILFLPDMFLGAYLQRTTGRPLHIWAGECHVHAGIRPADVAEQRATHPGAEFMIHPECGCVSATMYDLATGRIAAQGTSILSTEGMMRHARTSLAREFVVATEVGVLHRLRKDNPGKTFLPVSETVQCRYMKMITVDNLLQSLRHNRYVVTVPAATADRARTAIERMIAIT
jgi:quinolinate synthase